MKSTNNMGKGEFEKNWREAFDGAELNPSDQLWTGIEAVIANEDAARYRRGLVYYKWVAAAGILLFACLLGYVGYQYQWPGSSYAEKTLNPIHNDDRHFTDSTSSKSSIELAEVIQDSKLDEPTGQQPVRTSDQQIPKFLLSPEHRENLEYGYTFNRLALTRLNGSKSIQIGEGLELPTLPDQVTGIPIYPTEKDRQRTQFFAGLNLTPGYFNPNYKSQSAVQSLQAPGFTQGSTQPQENHQTGFSMTFGVEMGMRLSNRWQLSSGIQYLNNNVQSSTNAILNQRTPVFSSVVESLDLDDASANVTFEPTDLDNTFQFVSIPVQAGYLVLDDRVKLLINAGITSDIFLKNKITPVDQSLESITINPGSDAPFNSVYFNGLFGAQASYEFLPRYMITLEPRYKVAISDFTRSGTSYTSLPSSFGVGVGVRYIFK